MSLPGWEGPELHPFRLKVGTLGMEAHRLDVHMAREQGELVYFHIALKTMSGSPIYREVVEMWSEEGSLWRREHCRTADPGIPRQVGPIAPGSLEDVYTRTAEALAETQLSAELTRWQDA